MIQIQCQVVATKTASGGALGVKLVGMPAHDVQAGGGDVYVNVPYSEDAARTYYIGRRVSITLEPK